MPFHSIFFTNSSTEQASKQWRARDGENNLLNIGGEIKIDFFQNQGMPSERHITCARARARARTSQQYFTVQKTHISMRHPTESNKQTPTIMIITIIMLIIIITTITAAATIQRKKIASTKYQRKLIMNSGRMYDNIEFIFNSLHSRTVLIFCFVFRLLEIFIILFLFFHQCFAFELCRSVLSIFIPYIKVLTCCTYCERRP